jgi:hypothetical protein
MWTAAAERMAAPADPPAEAVAAVREAMAALAQRHVEAHDRYRDLGFRLSQAEPGSAAALAAELRSARDVVARWAAAPPAATDPARQAAPGG